MAIPDLILLALALSMDACAVSVCKGLSLPVLRPAHPLICGAYFGLFQALMPLLGCLLGTGFQSVIHRIDHWIAFSLLGVIGLNMLREVCSKEESSLNSSFSPAAMLPLAVATSIDALAVGVTFSLLQVNILPAAALIGAFTCLLSYLGVLLGRCFGLRWKNRAEFLGGVILLLMGTKILVEHLAAG